MRRSPWRFSCSKVGRRSHFNAGLAVFGVLQTANWVDLLGSDKAGIAVTAIGVVGAVLRFMTDTPAMKSN